MEGFCHQKIEYNFFFYLNREILAKLFNLIYYQIPTLTVTPQLGPNPNLKPHIKRVWMNIVQYSFSLQNNFFWWNSYFEKRLTLCNHIGVNFFSIPVIWYLKKLSIMWISKSYIAKHNWAWFWNFIWYAYKKKHVAYFYFLNRIFQKSIFFSLVDNWFSEPIERCYKNY